ncbi:MAG: GtrA family protein [Bacteroidaceae bacterium]
MAGKVIKEFGKAQVSSLFSTAFDFLVTAMIYEITKHVVISTATGAISGGIVNCITNYCWTFRGTTRTKRAIAWSYALVWTGSFVLNTSGTEWGVKSWKAFCDTNTEMPVGITCVLIVKAVVGILVAVFWNFMMQKYYVYKRS